METARFALIFLVCVCLWKTSCASSIQLCTNGPFSFVNGTDIPAMLGQPVSVVFCVQCNPRLYISPFIEIQHPHHPTNINYYYRNNNDVNKPIIVNITYSGNTYKYKATINITIKAVEKEDIADQFSVKLHTSKGVDDNSVFIFRLIDVSTSGNYPPSRPASASTSALPQTTRLSTLSTKTHTSFTPTATSTEVMPRCLPVQTSTCPQNWYSVDNDMCLIVKRFSSSMPPYYSREMCTTYGGHQVRDANLSNFTECLKYILGQSTPEPNNFEVRLDDSMFVNVQTGTRTSDRVYNKYNVACFSKKEIFKSPTVSEFTLNLAGNKAHSLAENRTNYITVNTATVYVRLTCKAEGMPAPHVVVTNESGNKITPSMWIQLAVCSRAEVYTCTADNSLGTVHAQGRIRLLSPLKVPEFTIDTKQKTVTESGETVKLICSVDGCPDRVTIIKNEQAIAEMTNYTRRLVHQIANVNCSHMGNYTCLAMSPTGQNLQAIAKLDVKHCTVSLCKGEDASRELPAILGGNVTFALCLMSSEKLTSSTNDTKIDVKFPTKPSARVYWAINITMYNIQVNDYRTHTVRIANNYGSLDVHFTLKAKGTDHSSVGQTPQGDGSESSAVLIAVPPVCFIVIVFIIVGVVWYRVKASRATAARPEEIIDRSSGNEDSGEVTYANMREPAVCRVPEGQKAGRQQEAEHQQEAEQETDSLQFQDDWNTADLNDKESGRFISQDGLVYITVVNANKQINKRSKRGKNPPKQKNDDEARVEYITLDFEKTGKLQLAEEEENKDDDSGDKNDTRQ